LRQFLGPSRLLLVRTLFVQTELTPNADAIKFIPGKQVAPATREYLDRNAAYTSPLAKSLFRIPGIKHIFLGPTFITVTKDNDVAWPILKPDIFEAIMQFYDSGQSIIDDSIGPADTTVLPGDSPVVAQIKELLETRVRPSIQEDGGDVEYCGFEDGKVLLKLKGACRTCDSSVVTLKNGIESMLNYYIPEVKQVEHVLEEEEKVSQQEFERLEEHLKNKH